MPTKTATLSKLSRPGHHKRGIRCSRDELRRAVVLGTLMENCFHKRDSCSKWPRVVRRNSRSTWRSTTSDE